MGIVIDISHWQGKMDFDKAAEQGVDGVIAKATQGNYFEDPTYHYNYREARKRNWFFGATHYMDYRIPAVTQFNYFKKYVVSTEMDLIAVDCEDSFQQTMATCTTITWSMLVLLQDYWNKRPTVYTAPAWWEANIDPDRNWKRFNLWEANYKVAKPTPIPPWNDDWMLWQYTEKADAQKFGVTKGVNYFIDLNKWNPRYTTPVVISTSEPSSSGGSMIVPKKYEGWKITIEGVEYTLTAK